MNEFPQQNVVGVMHDCYSFTNVLFIHAPSLFLQAGDGYLAGLAARFASELNFDEDDVLHQLEDLRSVATSDCWISSSSSQQSARSRRLSETETHNYANCPTSLGTPLAGHSEDKNFMPGIYAVSKVSLPYLSKVALHGAKTWLALLN